MIDRKHLLLICVFALNSFCISAQVKKESLSVVPVTYLDTTVKPAMITENVEQKNVPAEEEIKYETISVIPQRDLSIGKASAVYSTVKTNENSGLIDSLKYMEQRTGIAETPVNNSAVQPK